MDSELEKWRERPLGEYPYLFLDVYYEQVREDGQVRHLAVLVAVAVTPTGKTGDIVLVRSMWNTL
jgi:transposase-like protein